MTMMTNGQAPAEISVADRIAGQDWQRVADDLDTYGAATMGPLLTPSHCRAISASYEDDDTFRSRVVMSRHGFGRGEYKYWAYPLPAVVDEMRTALYPSLANIANTWRAALGYEKAFPKEHAGYLKRCHKAGQKRPTPLLLQYTEGDYNCLHQDLYGEHIFPLQVAVLLSDPGREFTGGEFVITEQRPRMQSRAEVVSLKQGEAVIFPVNARPVAGSKGTYRVKLRHGVSRLRSGTRYTMGIIFHDAA